MRYIDKNQSILDHVEKGTYSSDESQIMQNITRVFFFNKLDVYERCLYALEKGLLLKPDLIDVNFDYDSEFIAKFEAIREIIYEQDKLINKKT